MTQKNKWANEIIALVNMEKVEYRIRKSSDKTWAELKDDLNISHISWVFSHHDYEFRIAPKTININGHEVPEPLREAPKELVKYYVPHMGLLEKHYKYEWLSSEDDFNWLKNGLVHLTKEAAIKHAEALKSFTQSEEK